MAVGQAIGVQVKEEDISTSHTLPTFKEDAPPKIIVKFTRRDTRNSFYANRRKLIDKKASDLPDLGITVESKVYRFEILKFTYLWHKGLLPKLFSNYFQYARNVHNYNTRYASRQNLYVKKVRTNTGKQTIGYAACIIWDKIPLNLKELNIYQFSKQLKPYLLSEQHS